MLPLLSIALLTLGLPTSHAGKAHENTVEFVATGWYAGWHAEDFPVANVSWDKYTELTYAFAITTPEPTELFLNDTDKALLPAFVGAAHDNGVKASLSIGGWTGSLYFSSNVGSPENRTAFVKTVTDIALMYKLDGIDFDWEYPNRQGIGCNAISPNDTANFLAFLQELRADPVGQKLTLSAAVSLNPFNGPDGTPLADVSAFAKLFDYIAVMNYDVWGSWSTGVGPNAPLNDTCAPTVAQQQGSAVSAVKAWTAAGFPRSQIVLAVPAYGHSFAVTPTAAFVNGTLDELAAYPAFNASNQPVGDKWDDAAGPDVCGVEQSPGGTFAFRGMIEEGFLTAKGKPESGIAYRFDDCSQTPFVYNATSQVMISYDNAKSFSAKGDFIKYNNLRGFAIWESGGDFHDILLDSIRTAAGLNDDDPEDCDDR